jgi:hypothetical protein
MMEVVSWEPLETLGRRVATIKYKKATFSKVSERTLNLNGKLEEVNSNFSNNEMHHFITTLSKPDHFLPIQILRIAFS